VILQVNTPRLDAIISVPPVLSLMPPEKTSQKQFHASAGGPVVNPALFSSSKTLTIPFQAWQTPPPDAILAYPIDEIG
jgi:hypothetical protein